MSNIENINWLENAKENFEEALEKGDWALCRAIIDDLHFNHFHTEAETLRKNYEHVKWSDR